MAIIFEDLVASKQILAGIAKLEKANEQWADSAVKQNQRVAESMAMLKGEAASLKDKIESYKSVKSGGSGLEGLKDDFIKVKKAGQDYQAVLDRNQKLLDLNGASVDAMKKRLADLRAEHDKLDRSQASGLARQKAIHAEMKATAIVVNALASETNKASRAVKVTENTYTSLKVRAAQLRSELNELAHAYDDNGGINKQNKQAVELNKHYKETIDLLGKIDRGRGNHTGNVGNYPTGGAMLRGGAGIATEALGALGVGIGAFDIASQITEIGAEYEKLNLMIETSYAGNKQGAKEAQAIIKDFADHSPAQLAEVTTAFSRLRDIGINPTKKELTEISDMASAKNKSVMDYVEAIADAQMGEFERLKEFGINAQRDGDKVSFTFKGITTTVKASQKAISEYLLGLGEMPGVVGATERLAASASGKWSTLKDVFAGLSAELFNRTKPALIGLMDWVINGANKGLDLLRDSSNKSVESFTAQADKVNKLEQALPPLLTRYDELKSKSKLSADEQKELQTVVNSLAEIVPSAATGFDSYGNALDVNKGKVLSYTSAQRQLNAEMNKQAIKDLTSLATKQVGGTKFLQNNLKQGVKTRNPYAPAEDMTAADKQKLSGEIKDLSNQAQTTIKQIISNGGTLTGELRKYIESSGDFSTKQLVLIDDTNKKIADKQAQAAVLFQKGAFKQREGVVKEISKLQTDLGQIINPTTAAQKAASPVLSDKPLSGGKKEKKAKEPDTELEKLDKQIKKIVATLETQAMQDLKAGRIIDVDPKLVAKVDELRKKYNSLKDLKEAVENGTYNKKPTFDADTLDITGDVFTGKTGKGSQVAKGTTALSNEKLKELDRKRLADLTETLGKQSGIMQEYSIRRTGLENDFSKTLTDARRGQYNELVDLLTQMEDAEKAGDNKRLENLKLLYGQKRELYKKDVDVETEVRQKAGEVWRQAAYELANGLFEIQINNTQRRMESLDKQKEAEINNSDQSEGAKAAIEKKYDEQRKQLQRKQDQDRRNQSLFNIVVSGAEAIAKTFSMYGFPAGVALAVAQAGLTAVQLGVVASQELPQYKDGKGIEGLDTYTGPAIAGEAGRELWFHGNQVDLVDRPSLINVGRKDVILPNYLTERFLNDERAFESNRLLYNLSLGQQAGQRLQVGREQQQSALLARAMAFGGSGSASAIGKAVATELSKLPYNYTTFDERGVSEFVSQRNSLVKNFTKRNQFKKPGTN